VQSTQKSTDLRAKCGILWDFGQLEVFFRKWFLCQSFIDGETMYVHRFLSASIAHAGDSNEGKWAGRIR
jgi:hypothetical protein